MLAINFIPGECTRYGDCALIARLGDYAVNMQLDRRNYADFNEIANRVFFGEV